MYNKMTSKTLMGLFVSVFCLAFLAASASAFGSITDVEINGVDALDGSVTLADFAGNRVPVLVVFEATDNATDVRVKAWVAGERENIVTSERFDVIEGRTYSRVVFFDLPFDFDELDESRSLELVVESKNDGTADEVSIDFTVQRESYLLEILAIDMQPTVKAGDSLVLDVVVKNRGRHESDDAFLRVRVPELGLETTTYFGDLSPTDQSNPDKDDAVERRTYLKIPSTTQAGLFTVQIEAFNDDSFASAERRVLVVSAGTDTSVVSASNSKTFAVGEEVTYTMSIVNRGDSVGIYKLTVNAPEALNVDVSEPVVVVPAGSSRTVQLNVIASDDGKHSFSVDIESDSESVTGESFTANVEESGFSGTGTGIRANTTVLLTVILAIIFIVLLVVLIVLLTRSPEKSEEASESYY